MVIRRIRFQVAILAVLFASLAPSAFAQIASERILPATTKGFLAVPDVDQLQQQWDKTQLGQLMADPVMQPFVEDFQRQIKEKLSESGKKLELTWADLENVYGGEAVMATIQPGGDVERHGLAVIVDITAHQQQAQQLLAKIKQNQINKGATQLAPTTVAGVTVTGYALPAEQPELPPTYSYYAIKADHLLAADDLNVLAGMLKRFDADDKASLASVEAFSAAMQHAAEASAGEAPQVRWFIEPFGYLQVVRASQGGKKQRGKDMLKILMNQGFAAVQGVGGHVFLADGKHEILHRTLIYAPPVARDDTAKRDKYDLAARMLNFPNGSAHTPPTWIPRELAGFTSFNWEMKEAFEYSSTLVDEMAAAEGTFEDVLDALATDPHGPQIDIRKELVAHLDDHAFVFTDYRTPITPESERMLGAIAVTDPATVAATLEKALKDDPQAKKLVINGQVIWEIVSDQEEGEIPALVIDGPFDSFDDLAPAEDETEEVVIPNAALTVAHGHLLVANHVDFVVDVLAKARNRDTLKEAADYQLVQQALQQLGAGEDSFHQFSRTDEAVRPTYELMKQGKMPQSETMLGKVLNRILGSGEEGDVREQEIDGSKLPDYQVVRRYLGPSGLYVRSLDEGWMMTGVLLEK
jgi:hypothetical protein